MQQAAAKIHFLRPESQKSRPNLAPGLPPKLSIENVSKSSGNERVPDDVLTELYGDDLDLWRWVNDAGGDWGLAANWRDVATNTARVPTAADDVLIDVPTDALITISEAIVTVNSLVSNDRFRDSESTFPDVSDRLIRYMIVNDEVVFERRAKRR